MRTHRGTAGAVVILMLVVAATALAVTPKTGAKFSGTAKGKVTFATSFTAKDPLSFKTSSNGKAIDGFTFKDTVCDFAKSGQAPVGTIKVSGGKFSASNLKTKQVATSTGGGKAYWIVTVNGKFTSPTKASGKLTYTQKGTKPAGSSCGPIKLSFTATG
jgi:hypothetical protein